METQKPVGQMTRTLLKLIHEAGSVQYRAEPFKLISGRESRVYASFRDDLTKHPALFHLVSREIVRAVRHAAGDDPRSPCLIGIPTAGAALATGATCADWNEPEFDAKGKRRPPIVSVAMRQIRKRHGAHRGWVDGTPDTGKYLYCPVDNCLTDGMSKREMSARLMEDGYPAYDLPWIILVDREEGGIARMQESGLTNVRVVFTLRDIIEGFKQYGFWEKETADTALAEL